jgi:hypothetical protein
VQSLSVKECYNKALPCPHFAEVRLRVGLRLAAGAAVFREEPVGAASISWTMSEQIMRMRSTIISEGRPALPARVDLSRRAQIRSHLICVGRQLGNGHLDRVPFHLRGIVRAMIL